MRFPFWLSLSFFGFLFTKIPFVLSAVETVEGAVEKVDIASLPFGNSAVYAISAAIAIGLAAFGGALGQGKLGAATMEGIARNPQSRKEMFALFFVAFVLIESLVIYAFVIAIMLVIK